MVTSPSLAPNEQEQTIYLVLCDYGPLGQAYCETNPESADLETTLIDLISGQYDNPVRVVAFNTSERWSDDVSKDVARETMRRVGIAGGEMSESLADFVDEHLGPERQLTCGWHRPRSGLWSKVYRCAYSQNARMTSATIKAIMPAAESASQNFAIP